MKWLGKARLFNAAIGVLAVLAWLTGTNHCMLKLMKQPEKTAVSMSYCPEHSPKSSDANHGASGMLACCQGLQSPDFEVGKTKISINPVLVEIQLSSIGGLVFPDAPRTILPSTEYETGPPSVHTFVETVLRCSLPENAPPLVS